MYLDLIQDKLLSNHQLISFIEMKDIITRIKDRDGTCWDYAFLACEAVNGNALDALHAAAANFCMLSSIKLVDDMLDNDPTGDYHLVGVGTAANMALAFQSVGIKLISDSALPETSKAAIIHRLTQMMLDTSLAQQHEAAAIVGNEQDYWEKIGAKTPPLFAAALFSGAICGGTDTETACRIADLGSIYGRMIQVSDDLSDIFRDSRSPDWSKPHNNLALLYCMEAEYELKPKFMALLKDIGNNNHLELAQDIITSAGGLSYCIYHLMELNKQLISRVGELDIRYRNKLLLPATSIMTPVVTLLQSAGVEDAGKYVALSA